MTIGGCKNAKECNMMMRKRAVAAFAVIIGALLVMSGLTGCGNGNIDPGIPEHTITLTFDSDGGSSVPSQTVKEGGRFTKPVDPTKDGYEFLGWYGVLNGYVDNSAFDFDQEYIMSGTVRAKWLPLHDVTASDIAETIRAMTETGKIIAHGAFTEDDFTKEGGIRDALLELLKKECPVYSSYYYPEILVTLNLSGVTGLTSIPDYAFFGYSEAQKDEDGEEITNMDAYPACINLKSIILPATVTSIGDRAFGVCRKLESLELSDKVTSIGNHAFRNCDSLETVKIPSTCKTIGSYAFEGCSGITSITLPATMESIGSEAFKNCRKITSITLPSGIKEIASSTFQGCESLESIVIPATVTEIWERAFTKCEALKAINIPKNVTIIRKEAFADCYALTSIVIPDSVTYIGDRAFSYYYNHDEETTMRLKSVKLGKGVKEIGAAAFYELKDLTTVEIPEDSELTTIGHSAFENCSSLASIRIPAKTKEIGNGAFASTGLKSITIPENVNAIWARAFWDCENLTSVVFEDTNITWYRSTSWSNDGLKSEFDDEVDGIGIDASKNAEILKSENYGSLYNENYTKGNLK